MAIVESESFEVENGIVVSSDDGATIGPFYSGGPTSPVGMNLSQNTFYVQNLGNRCIVWQKFGASVNDWRVFPAQDISFDPTGLQNIDPTDTDVQLALERLGNQTQGDLTEAESFNSVNTETTTSNGWVSKSGFPYVTGIKTAGKFEVRWFAEVGQTRRNRNFGFRCRAAPSVSALVVLSSVELTLPRNNNVIMQSGFQEIELPSDGTITIDLEYGQTTNGFSAIIQNASVLVQRTGDI